jgi:hypothetical protein
VLFVTRSPEWAPPGIEIPLPAGACGAARGISRTRAEVFALSAGIDIVEAGSAGRAATNAGIGRKI